jgi:DNA-binding NarL/FixJ family response regulator
VIDRFIEHLRISGALLDADGVIIDVSEGWKQFAESGKLTMENFGIGQNYLRHSVFPDPASVAILNGLQSVLQRKVDLFSTLYPCDMPSGRGWFILIIVAVDRDARAAAGVLHLDVSLLLRDPDSVSARMIGVGAGALDPSLDAITGVVRRAIAASLQMNGSRTESRGTLADQKRLKGLTAHQLDILRELGQGASNAEIAAALGISLSSAKSQTAALIRRLGLANRARAALFAVKNGLAGLN